MMSSNPMQLDLFARRAPSTRSQRLYHFLNGMMLLLLWMDTYLATASRTEFFSLNKGVRSALMGSINFYGRSCNAKSKKVHQLVDPYVLNPITHDIHEEDSNEIETAFYKQDSVHQRTAETAYLKRKPIVKSRKYSSHRSELEFLDLGVINDENGSVDCFPASTQYSHSRCQSSIIDCRTRRANDDCRFISNVKSSSKKAETLHFSKTQGVAGTSAKASKISTRPLVFWENMICGAVSRSIAQTAMHPANTMKTILQNSRRGAPNTQTIWELMLPRNFRRLTVGAGANFILSVPHGAVNFAVLEYVRHELSLLVRSNPVLAANERRFSFGLDFLSSTISTIVCSVISTPQMMITDNIMAGNYPSLRAACVGLAERKGWKGFYSGWWPGLVGKIPSYALTWAFFQELKNLRNHIYSTSRPIATDAENTIMGCLASAATVCLMIPMDTIKTRLVSQAGQAASDQAYKGIIDCAVRVFREEGVAAFYRGLPPRLASVVPMIGIQFGVNEFMRRLMLQRRISDEKESFEKKEQRKLQLQLNLPKYEDFSLQEAMMEVAASLTHPYPVPRFSK